MYNKNIKKSERKQKTSRLCDKNSIVGLLSKSDRKQIHQESHGKRIELSALVERRVEKDCRHNSFKYTATSFRQNMVMLLFPPSFLCSIQSYKLINTIDLKRYGFVSSPQMVLVATPQVGEKEVSYSAITDWIADKLKQEFQAREKTVINYLFQYY